MSKINESIIDDILTRNKNGELKMEDAEFVERVKAFVARHDIKDIEYKINASDYSVSFFRSIKVDKEDLVDGKLPFKFGTVKGRCYMNDLGLTTLENSPTTVEGDFVIYDNNIRNFIGGPEFIGGTLAANVNRSLETLDGSPKKVDGNYSIRFTLHLRDVSGITPDIGGRLEVSKDFQFDDEVRKYSNVKEIDKK